MPRSMPTLSFPCPCHGLQRVLLLGMDVAPSGPDVAVAGQILQCEHIHVGRPTGEARVPEGVKVEGFELRQPASFGVLFFETGRLDVPTGGWSSEQPRRTVSAPISNFDDCVNASGHRDF